MKQKKYFVRIDGLNTDIEYREPFYPSEQGHATYTKARGVVVAYLRSQAEKFYDMAATVQALSEVEYFQS